MDAPRSSATEHPVHHRPRHPGRQHLGHPLQGRRQVDDLVPDQGLRGQGLHGSQDVGRADRPVRQDRRRRQPTRGASAPAAPARRPAGRSPTGSRKWSSRPRAVDYYNDWISHKVTFQDPGIKDAFDKYVGKIFFTPKATSSAATRRSSPPTRRRHGSDVHDDTASPKCWMQKIPTWYGPDFFPDQRASGQPIEVRHRRRTSGSSRSRRSTRPRTMPRARLTRSWCSSTGPRSAPSPSSLPRRRASRSWIADRQRHLDQRQRPRPSGMPAPTSSRSLPRSRTAPRASASTLPTSCPAKVGAGTFWTQSVQWANNGGTNTDAVLKAIDDSWPQ